MKFLKFVIVLLLIGAIATASYYLLDHYQVFAKKELTHINQGQAIPFEKDEDIYFFKDGFIITGSNPRYFDSRGRKINNPFSQDDLLDEEGALRIKLTAGNYICTELNNIYDTTTRPFKRVFDNSDNLNIWDMKDAETSILIIVEQGEKVLEPYALLKNSGLLLSYDGRGDAKYLEASIDKSSKGVSLLSLSLDSLIPISRVFNYANINEAYGAISIEDQIFFDIYRLDPYIILIGTDRIVCYNISGQQMWTVENPSKSSYQAVYKDNSLLLYFNESLSFEGQSANGIKIDRTGSISLLNMPVHLTSISSYKKGYVALEFGNTLILLDDKGGVKKRHKIDGLAKGLYISEYQEETFYIRGRDNTLEIYVNQRKDEQD